MIHLAFFDPVVERIQEVEDLMLQQADGHHPELVTALKHLLSSGGKRIRVAVTLLTGAMLRADANRLVTLAAAIELLHTATLVHDDLIDGSLIRRGLPTLNSSWTPAATVLTGDFIFARAAKLASDVESVPVNKLFSQTLAVIVSGEVSQMFSKRGMISFEDYEKRIYAKTASLFETATTSAGLICSLDEPRMEKVKRFGYGIGMAFQIVDDILDFTGEQSTVGKPVASDLRQGLVTLPAMIYDQIHPDDPSLSSVLNDDPSEEKIMVLVKKIRKSGAIDLALDEARKYVKIGLDALSFFPDCSERDSLQNLALYIVNRSK